MLRREGATLATYGLNSGPLGYRPLREFLAKKLKDHAGIGCSPDEILITSGSMQGLELVNSLLLAKGDTVLIEQETYGGALTKLTKLGVNVIGIPLDEEGLRLDIVEQTLADLKKKGVTPKYIYTIPTVQNPTGAIMGETRRAQLIKLAAEYGVMIFEDECYSDLIWSGERPRSIYSMANGEGVIEGTPQYAQDQPYGAAVAPDGRADCEAGQRGFVERDARFFPSKYKIARDPRSPGLQGPTFAGRPRVPEGQTFTAEPETGEYADMPRSERP